MREPDGRAVYNRKGHGEFVADGLRGILRPDFIAELTPAAWGHPKTAEVQQYRRAYG